MTAYFDNKPIGAVTAEDVRKFRAAHDCRDMREGTACRWCKADLFDAFLPRLLAHNGVSSTARAVIEAMLGGAK